MSDRLRISGPRDRNARLELLNGWWDRSIVHDANLAVVGIGALGNEILKNLALLDFRSILLVDKDTVELSNLSRSVLFRSRHEGMPKVAAAAEALNDLNPSLRVATLHGDVVHEVGLGHFRGLDAIVAGLDSRRVRWWLNRVARALGVPWVEGATEGPHGHAVAFLPGDDPCYECSFSDADWRALDQVASCRQLQLDAAASGRVATSPTAASIIAATQVHLAMELLHHRPVQSGRSLLVNLTVPDAMSSGRRRNPDCDAHFLWDPIVESDFHSDRATVSQIIGFGEKWIGEPATVELRWDVVWDLVCSNCRISDPIRRPRGMVGYSEVSCPRCGAERNPSVVHRLTNVGHGDLSLAEVGIPAFDIVEIRGPKGSVWVELTGDRPAPGAQPQGV
jgi:molybdopterin/thiamine biosynthesis adenylyltransferase